jgi:phage gp16-like protein
MPDDQRAYFIYGCPGCRRAVRVERGKVGALCPVCHSELPSEPPARKRRVQRHAGAHSTPISLTQIKLIHVAKNRVGMTDLEYRDLLAGFKAYSCKQLNQTDFEQIMRHFHKLGFAWTPNVARDSVPCPDPTGQRPVPRESKAALLGKIGKQLTSLGLPWTYADRMASQMFKVALVKWLRPHQLHKLVAALTYHQQRQRDQRDAGPTGKSAGEAVNQEVIR